MKKVKQPSKVKSARKITTKAIQLRLISSLKSIAGQFGYTEEKLTKKVKKGSKKLAKAIAKGLEIAQPAKPEVPKEIKTKPVAPAVKAVAATKKPANKTPAAKPAPAKAKPVQTTGTKTKAEKK